jgi:VIT1/CCC1 family predicted Fe2+/Mn2+ transporter
MEPIRHTDDRSDAASGPRQGAPGQELHPHRGDWLREVVFGLNDGLVTTLVFIMTVSGVAAHSMIIVLIALSEVAAGSVSMALGGYLSAQTEREVLQRRIATEAYEIEHEPEEERAELRAIYREKGLQDPLLDQVVGQLTADRRRWLRALMRDEHGIIEEAPRRPPWQQGLQIGAAFLLGGLIPTLPFLLQLPDPRLWAYGVTALVAFELGLFKARYTIRGPVRSALEFLAIVTVGTLAGIVLGMLLHAV